MEELIKMRDALRRTADIIDEIIALGEREQAGENVDEEGATLLGKFLMAMMEINELGLEH